MGKRLGSFFQTSVFFFVFLGFFSCQKELDPEAYQTCLPQTIEVYLNGNANPGELYTYVYDPATLWPQSITLSIPDSLYLKTINVSFANDTIYLGAVGFIKLDGSRRITQLSLNEDLAGVEKGNYFYGYNNEGVLAERLFDNGDDVLERAAFTHQGTYIDSFYFQYEFQPGTLLGSLSYLSSPNGNGENNLLPYTDIFPELLPFAYMVKLGSISNDLPDKMKVLYESPGMPTYTLNYAYSSYGFNSDNLLTGFGSQLTVEGYPDYHRRFSIAYVCQ